MRQKIREIPAKIDKNSRGRGRDWGPLARAGAGILKIILPGPGPGKKHKSRPYPGPGPGSRSITGLTSHNNDVASRNDDVTSCIDDVKSELTGDLSEPVIKQEYEVVVKTEVFIFRLLSIINNK